MGPALSRKNWLAYDGQLLPNLVKEGLPTMREKSKFRSLGFSHDCSVLHHKIDRAKRFDIGERILRHGDDVGVDGSGSGRLVLGSADAAAYPRSVSPNSRYLIYERRLKQNETGDHIWSGRCPYLGTGSLATGSRFLSCRMLLTRRRQPPSTFRRTFRHFAGDL